MDIVKFKITPKTIKIEVRNTNNYVFDFNKAVEMEKEEKSEEKIPGVYIANVPMSQHIKCYDFNYSFLKIKEN